MIKIEITDPHNIDRFELIRLIDYLTEVADQEQESLKTLDLAIKPETEHNSTVRVPVEDIDPKPSAVFAKCSNVPEKMTLQDFEREKEFISPPASVELDSKGLPWDSRIHARTKTKNKDGSWKQLRGVGPKIVDKVQTELKDVQELPSIPLPPDAPIKDFAALMTLITTNVTNGKLERTRMNQVLNQFGIPSIPVVATRPDLIPAIMMTIEEIINEPV